MNQTWHLGIASVLFALAAFGQSSASLITDRSAAISDRSAARLLDQGSWGPTTASIQQAQTLGINGWLQAQFAAPVSDLPDQPLLNSSGKSNTVMAPVQAAFFQNTLSGQDQLRQRVAFALGEIFVVSAVTVHPAYAHPVYWRLLRDNAFGNYRDIMTAVTLSPAMGAYLNMANNNKANAKKGTAANENYAREFQQLFTIGLIQLNPDGSPVLDSNHNPIPTYNQAEITDTARVLTGWTYPTAPGATAKNNNPPYFIGQMIPVDAEHDTGAKTVIGGIQIPAGQTTAQDLDSLLDALMQQPTMAPFVSTQLIQHLVTSNPSPQYVERVSRVFSNDGTGTRGNMQAVLTAILTDPEARAGDDATASPNADFGHLREPVLFMANLLRGLNATLGPNSAIQNQTNQMGQELFFQPSVFSYFSPLYRTEKGLLGPEFQIYSTATVAARADIVNSILYGTLDKSTTFNFSGFSSLDTTTNAMIDAISATFFYHAMSSNLQQAMVNAATAASSPQKAMQAALFVALTSGEYQIVH
jgi:uncharacterized protein (DUF1800 family)